jgi:hypothetical protein
LKQLKPYYDDLFAEFLPETLCWEQGCVSLQPDA